MLQDNSPKITLFLDTPGGSIVAGDRLISAIKSTGKKVDCVADFAASMGFAILQLACDNRYVMPHTTLMAHQASYGLGAAPANNQRSMVNYIEGIIKSLESRQAVRMGLTLEQFRAKTAHDYWIYGTDAITENAADKSVPVICSKSLASKKVRKMEQVFIFQMEVERSACPLIKSATIIAPPAEE